MPELEVMSVRAPSLEKLERELSRLLAGCSADDVVSVSHSSTAVASRQSGGIWSAASQCYKVEYSALVLVRAW